MFVVHRKYNDLNVPHKTCDVSLIQGWKDALLVALER
jgi:hypothetical protein